MNLITTSIANTDIVTMIATGFCMISKWSDRMII